MNIKFELEEQTRANKVFLVVEFEGGDADTRHPEEIDLNIPYESWKQHKKDIEATYEQYEILADILNCNSSKHLESYDEVLKEYGEDIANMFENAPNDPQVDFSRKCYISGYHLLGYDNEGNIYKAHLYK